MIVVAALAMMVSGCRAFKRQIDPLLVYPTSSEEIAEAAKDCHADAAFLITKADTQYVLYRRACAYSKRDGIERCYAMRYVSQHRCRHDFSGRGGEFRLYEPEQPVVVTRNGDNALTLTVDSLRIPVTDIVTTDTLVTFRFGIDKPDREAKIYLYGKARGTKDVFAETSIQQMIGLALMLDDLMADWETDIDSGYVEYDDAMDEAMLSLEEAHAELEEAKSVLDSSFESLKAFDYYAECLRMDSIAGTLGFTGKHTVALGDKHLKYVATGGEGGSKACYARMERMAEAAKTCHIKRYAVEHKGSRHRKCKVTIEW